MSVKNLEGKKVITTDGLGIVLVDNGAAGVIVELLKKEKKEFSLSAFIVDSQYMMVSIIIVVDMPITIARSFDSWEEVKSALDSQCQNATQFALNLETKEVVCNRALDAQESHQFIVASFNCYELHYGLKSLASLEEAQDHWRKFSLDGVIQEKPAIEVLLDHTEGKILAYKILGVMIVIKAEENFQ